MEQQDDDEVSKDTSISTAIEFAELVGRLKTTPRTGWVRKGVPKYESVADHSWRVAVLALLLNDDHVDVSKCIQLALVHDLAECIVGDVVPGDILKSEKQRREHDAMERIVALLQQTNSASAMRLKNLFEEYEQRTTPEAVAVKDLDMLDMILQANTYEERYSMDLSEFFGGTPPSLFCNESLRPIAAKVHEKRKRRDQQAAEQQLVSASDKAFVEEFTKASSLKRDDILQVVQALRHWDSAVDDNTR